MQYITEIGLANIREAAHNAYIAVRRQTAVDTIPLLALLEETDRLLKKEEGGAMQPQWVNTFATDKNGLPLRMLVWPSEVAALVPGADGTLIVLKSGYTLKAPETAEALERRFWPLLAAVEDVTTKSEESEAT